MNQAAGVAQIGSHRKDGAQTLVKCDWLVYNRKVIYDK